MNNRIFGYASVAGAIFYSILSIHLLLGYGASTGLLTEERLSTLFIGGVVIFLLKNYALVASILSFLLLAAYLFIYAGFIQLSGQIKNRYYKISSYLILFAFALQSIFSLFSFSSFQLYIALIAGIASILFGIALINVRHSLRGLFAALGIFFVLQGVISLSILLLPIRLADFMLPIFIAEAVLFFVLKDKK